MHTLMGIVSDVVVSEDRVITAFHGRALSVEHGVALGMVVCWLLWVWSLKGSGC